MPKKVLAISGGGVRIYGTIGALVKAEEMGIDFTQFDVIQATSSGTIVALMLLSGMTPKEIEKKALELPLETFIDMGPFGLKFLFWGVSNEGLSKWADSLELTPTDKLVINTFDSQTNKQYIFTKEDYAKHGYGYATKCSTRYPGVMTPVDGKYLDGGVAENPVVLNLEPDDQILCVYLGYAGEVQHPKFHLNLLRRLEEAVYTIEYLNYRAFNFMIDKFENMDIIWPKIYGVSSVNFWITKDDMKKMIQEGKDNTEQQWDSIKSKWI